MMSGADADFEAWLERFERAERAGPVDLATLLRTLPPASAERRREQLLECIAVDLEFCWRRNPHSGPLLESYLVQFPELGPRESLPAEWIAEEYRARQRWGDRPSHEELLTRFPSQRGALAELLWAVDAEWAAEATADEPSETPESWLATLPLAAQPLAQIEFNELLLQRQIGAGGMGKVYQASLRGHPQPVAVKFLKKSLLRHPRAVQRLLSEAQLVAALAHPHLLRIHGVGQTSGAGCFIVMDLAGLGDLSERLGPRRPELVQLLGWLGDAADVLELAHQSGVIHCDLKPSNLLIGAGGHLYVADFGLAQPAGNRPASEHWEGTLGYLAPEQLDRDSGSLAPTPCLLPTARQLPTARLLPTTDVYGLGATLFAILSGHPPYTGNCMEDIIDRIRSSQPVELPATVQASVPARVTEIVARCLAKSPAERYPTAADLRDALDEARLELVGGA